MFATREFFCLVFVVLRDDFRFFVPITISGYDTYVERDRSSKGSPVTDEIRISAAERPKERLNAALFAGYRGEPETLDPNQEPRWTS